jgi:excisionase family DNA binding protein
MTSTDEYLTLDEIADLTRTPLSSVRAWVRLGKLAATRPGRRVLVSRTDLDTLLRTSAIRGRTQP